MNIDILSKMVRDLILDNDRVSLPGLGSFVAESVPASFSDDGYSIRPPYRKMYFRRNLEPDKLLIEAYSKAEGLSQEESEAVLTEFISEMKAVLNRQKVIIFPGLGKLRATQENNYFFVTDSDIDICPEYDRLSVITLKVRKEPGSVLGRYSFADPQAAPQPESTPQPESASQPQQTPQLSPEPESQPSPKPQADPQQDPAFQPQPALLTDPQPQSDPQPQPEPAPRPEKKRLGKGIKAAIWTCAAVAAAFAAFVLFSRLMPGSTDFLLYSSGDIEILRAAGL